MHFRLPNFKRTFEFVKRLADLFSYGKIAQISGVSTDVADDWARPYESDEFPSGTGKKDPSQTVLRMIGLAHSKDPGLAREWASVFLAYVDFLDAQSGVKEWKTGNLCAVIADSAKEHMDLVVEYMHTPNPAHEKVWSELQQAKSALLKAEACLREELKERSEAEAAIKTKTARRKT